jgi:hypothetical protein
MGELSVRSKMTSSMACHEEEQLHHVIAFGFSLKYGNLRVSLSRL